MTSGYSFRTRGNPEGGGTGGVSGCFVPQAVDKKDDPERLHRTGQDGASTEHIREVQ